MFNKCLSQEQKWSLGDANFICSCWWYLSLVRRAHSRVITPGGPLCKKTGLLVGHHIFLMVSLIRSLRSLVDDTPKKKTGLLVGNHIFSAQYPKYTATVPHVDLLRLNTLRDTSSPLQKRERKIVQMGALQKLQNSIQTLTIFWTVYPIRTNSLF